MVFVVGGGGVGGGCVGGFYDSLGWHGSSDSCRNALPKALLRMSFIF